MTGEKMRAVVSESTSSWFKSVIDPAHARDYGCAGIPDENKQPTLVYSDRITVTYSANQAVSNSTWVNTNTGEVISSFTLETITSIVIFSLANPWYLYIGIYATGKASSANVEAFTIGVAHTNMTTPRGQEPFKAYRYVGGSITADVIGELMYTGGYFETGYWPQATGQQPSDYGYVVQCNTEPSYATRTCNWRDGCYSVHRMTNYDWARVWRTSAVTAGIGALAHGSSTPVVVSPTWLLWPTTPQTYGNSGFDPLFVKYYPSGSQNWVLRVTYNYQVEVQTPYSAGGTDGASYDQTAIMAYMAIADTLSFTYPSSYNDLRRLINGVKTFLKRSRTPIQGVLRSLPYGNTWSAIFDTLIDSGSGVQRRQNRTKRRKRNLVVMQMSRPRARTTVIKQVRSSKRRSRAR